MQIDYPKIKLVIWDLDDTFWKGTLSEGPIEFIPSNVELVKTLTDCGVINTICSKNDEAPVREKLQEIGLENYFVFCSINWLPKGNRIHQLIIDMGLRAPNCLFLDDNIVNINEALHYTPELMTAEPDAIASLKLYFDKSEKTDIKHKRLQQYQVLEQKQNAKASASDNLSFLYESNTQVEICHDCHNQLDRIHELVNRSNQLNYTKKRSSKEEIQELLSEPEIKAGYVKVKDKFGDYGTVGFYAIKNDTLIHFLFSCRTIGQGVEQYVYATIGYPQLTIVGEVVNSVTMDEPPSWINQKFFDNTVLDEKISGVKILFKGGCDLTNLTAYLNTTDVIEEFAYISKKRKNYVEHQYHCTNLLSFPFMTKEERKTYLDEYIFGDEDMFDTHIYDKDLAIAFLGIMIDPHLGVYRKKGTNHRIAFGESYHPLTNPQKWDDYINGTIFTADNHFTKDWLMNFSDTHEFLGALTPIEIIHELKKIFSMMSPNAKLCLLLGSETAFEKEENETYYGREKIYKQLNDFVRAWAQEEERVLIIDFNKFIHSQEDFTNNINHFQRRVYYEAATEANQIISAITGEKLRQRSKCFLRIRNWADELSNTGFFQTKLWHFMRIPYIWIKSKL